MAQPLQRRRAYLSDPFCRYNVEAMLRFIYRVFLLWVALTLCCAANGNGEDRSGKTGPYDKAFIPAKICGECHKEIYQMWETSMHAHAADDPIFEASFALAYLQAGEKAKILCLRCHAPTTLLTQDYEKRLAITDEGVTCDFCHSVLSVDLSTSGDPFFMNLEMFKEIDWRRGRSFHDRRISGLLRRSEFCAGCHEFTGKNGVSLLGTYSEWKGSSFATDDLQCQGCHMPLVGGGVKDHRMVRLKETLPPEKGSADSSEDTHVHAEELEVRVEKVQRKGGNLSVTVRLRNSGTGHRVPTGLPSRSLELICQVRTAPQGEVLSRSKIYRKKVVEVESGEIFGNDSGFFLKPAKIVEDNRPAPRETLTEEFKFLVPPDSDLHVKAYVNYRYQPVLLQKTEMTIHGSEDEKAVDAVHDP
jgi:hypothetical protein